MLHSPLLNRNQLVNALKSQINTYRGNSTITREIKNNNVKVFDLNYKEKTIHDLPNTLYKYNKKNLGEVDALDIALSLKSDAFLYGYKLISMLGWTEYIPKVIHVSHKRMNSKKYYPNKIDNESLQNAAFKAPRMSKNIIIFESYEIIFLTGKFIPDTHFIINTDIGLPPYADKIIIPERLILETLINYHCFGGADIVWEIGLERFNDIDLELMYRIYKDMDLTYPYAQAIGYWLEAAGIHEKDLRIWRGEIVPELQFHLFMGDGERRLFNKTWNLYVPKRFR